MPIEGVLITVVLFVLAYNWEVIGVHVTMWFLDREPFVSLAESYSSYTAFYPAFAAMAWLWPITLVGGLLGIAAYLAACVFCFVAGFLFGIENPDRPL